MKTFIYTLSHPESGEIRYVGKTTNLKRRFYQHSNIKVCKKLTNKHLGNWLLSILNKQLVPIMDIIEECENDWVISEQYWIEQFKVWGFNILNVTKGGEGFGHKHTEESKKKMSLSQKGVSRNFSKEVIEQKRLHFKSENNPMKNPISKQKVIDARTGNNTWVTEYMKEKARNHIQESVKNNTQVGNKPVLQYDLEGNFIREWVSITSIKKELGFSKECIIRCCKEKTISTWGYVWKYKIKDEYPLKINVSQKEVIVTKQLIKYNKDMNELTRYNSLKEASIETTISKGAILNNIAGLSKSAGGFIWKYEQLNN